MQPYYLTLPKKRRFGLIISCPHAGTEFPEAVQTQLRRHHVDKPVDTDWFVHELYGFAPELGIPLLSAEYSRYVVDLNRDPSGAALYHDKRMETAVVPVRTFAGEPLYGLAEPSETEIRSRLSNFYQPYHVALEALIRQTRQQFGYAFLLDGHSIKRHVPLIQSAPFPDMILGNNDGKTCRPELLEVAKQALASAGNFRIQVNHPFKGGFITRKYGDKNSNVQSLQLEMSQDLYLNEEHLTKVPGNFATTKKALQTMIEHLARYLERWHA